MRVNKVLLCKSKSSGRRNGVKHNGMLKRRQQFKSGRQYQALNKIQDTWCVGDADVTWSLTCCLSNYHYHFIHCTYLRSGNVTWGWRSQCNAMHCILVMNQIWDLVQQCFSIFSHIISFRCTRTGYRKELYPFLTLFVITQSLPGCVEDRSRSWEFRERLKWPGELSSVRRDSVAVDKTHPEG